MSPMWHFQCCVILYWILCLSYLQWHWHKRTWTLPYISLFLHRQAQCPAHDTQLHMWFFFFELNWIMKWKGGEEQVFQNRRQEIRPTKSGSSANSRHPSIVGGFFVQRAGNWALRTTQPLPLWPIASDCGLWSQLCWNAGPATFCVIAGKLLNFPYLGFSSVKPGQRWSLIIKSCHENKWKGPCGALRLVPGRGSVG